MQYTIIAATSLLMGALAHSTHEQKPIVPDNANWMTKHMAGTL